MSDITDWQEGPPHVDDGEDVNRQLPALYPKNGDVFVNVAFGTGKSIFNQTIMNGFKING